MVCRKLICKSTALTTDILPQDTGQNQSLMGQICRSSACIIETWDAFRPLDFNRISRPPRSTAPPSLRNTYILTKAKAYVNLFCAPAPHGSMSASGPNFARFVKALRLQRSVRPRHIGTRPPIPCFARVSSAAPQVNACGRAKAVSVLRHLLYSGIMLLIQVQTLAMRRLSASFVQFAGCAFQIWQNACVAPVKCGII